MNLASLRSLPPAELNHGGPRGQSPTWFGEGQPHDRVPGRNHAVWEGPPGRMLMMGTHGARSSPLRVPAPLGAVGTLYVCSWRARVAEAIFSTSNF